MANRKTTFLLRRSNVIDKIPDLSGLTIGELALNTADAKLYTIYTSGTTGTTEVREIGWNRLSTISGGTVSGDTIFISGVTGDSFNIFSTPVNNNTNTEILTRNSTTGNVEYRDVSTISGGASGDYLPLSGGTVSGKTFFSGGLSATTIEGSQVELITAGETLSPGDLVYLFSDGKYYKTSNTGDTTSSTELRIVLNSMFLNNDDIALVNGQYDFGGPTLTAGDLYWVGNTPGSITNTQPTADGSIVRYVGTALSTSVLEFNSDPTYVEISSGFSVEPTECIPNLYVSNLHSCSPLHINPINSEGDIYIGENGGVNVGIGTNNPLYLLDVNGTVNATNFNGSGSSLSNIPISGVTNLQDSLNSKTNTSLFTGHTSDLNNPHETSLSNLFGGSAHTHTITEITDLSNQLSNKLGTTGGTITGNLVVQQDFTVLGSATTINTNILAVENNLVTLNSNLTGNTVPFFGVSGLEILRGSATTANLVWNENSQKFVAGLTGSTKQILLSGDSLSLLSSGHTHPISEITNLQTTLDNKLNTSGGTISGSLSATTFYGDGSNLTGIITTDYYVTGGTFSGTTLTLRRNGLSDIPITGFTSTGNFLSLTGGTVSGDTTFTTGVTLFSLTGTTDRLVEVNSSGNVSANRAIISAYLTGGTVVTDLVNVSNWSSKNYVGPAITGTYQGQKYYNADYFFEAVDNNVWIRLSRV
jgi:hypothetical protein